MLRLIFLALFIFSSFVVLAQNIDSVKAMPRKYIWGEATAKMKKIADQEALVDLVSQISTTVSSEFSLLKKETSKKHRVKYTEVYNSVISSYSKVTLRNTNRLVVENKGSVTVFRYIERTEVRRIFEDREHKIREYINLGNIYLTNNNVSGALRYYYWSLVLLQSHPDGDRLTIINDNQLEQTLATWLPMKVNEVFASLQFKFVKEDKQNDTKKVLLSIKYKGNLVSRLDYQYLNYRRRWSEPNISRNGKAHIYLKGNAALSNFFYFKVLYVFNDETYSDEEVVKLLKEIPIIEFPTSIYKIEDSLVIDEQNVQSIADDVGAKLMRCCSKWGCTNYSTTVDWTTDLNGRTKTRYNTERDKLFIYMSVFWQGSVSGMSYRITGRLTVDLKTGKKHWVKESDSGWFKVNCGSDCDINN